MAFPFFTIGHSTRPIGEFIDLLVASEVGLVVDVRTIPRSRTNPHYNRETLPGSLSGFQIAYEHVAELGGRRAREEYCARGQRLLGEPELSQLRRLCDGRRFSFWPPHSSLSFPPTLVAPAMALAVIGLMFLSKWLFKGDVKWISDEIEKSLRDPRSA